MDAVLQGAGDHGYGDCFVGVALGEGGEGGLDGLVGWWVGSGGVGGGVGWWWWVGFLCRGCAVFSYSSSSSSSSRVVL